MSGAVLAFPGVTLPEVETFGGLTLAVGTWLYSHVPASERDCGVVERIEGDTGTQAYDVFGGMRALPRTRVWVRWDGGTAPARPVEHIDQRTLTNYRESNGLTGYFGFLAARFPDEDQRADFVRYRSEAPARRAEAARLADEERERVRREVGPWFADLEAAHAAYDKHMGRGYVPDTIEAKVLRRCLRELVGVKASVKVRRYSMASGLDFGPADRDAGWTDDEGRRIASVFPGLAWADRVYNRETGEWRDGWRVSNDAHPSKRDDRSDLQSDYHDPGGFRVANAYLLDVSRILSEEIERAAK